ncbi:class I SAM-dependent methyltransferase [Verrucomicrobiota bacterium sgz303538]
MNSVEEIQGIYERRFASTAAYRSRVWSVLTKSFFSKWISPEHDVLDLGCGYGEFINQIDCRKRYALDLNPDAPSHLDAGVQFFQQDCSTTWPLPEASVDVIFTSNFFEHLPSKQALSQTLRQAIRCLRPNGRLIALGPNAKYLGGAYWDFFDHHTVLTEMSLGEAMSMEGFEVEAAIPRFLPYTLVNAPEYPLFFLKLYLALPFLWRAKGRQFLVICRKPF